MREGRGREGLEILGGKEGGEVRVHEGREVECVKTEKERVGNCRVG